MKGPENKTPARLPSAPALVVPLEPVDCEAEKEEGAAHLPDAEMVTTSR